MTDQIPPARIVLTTIGNPDEAASMARSLVDERLAACATLIPAVQSIYRWQGEVEASTETLVLIKTTADKLAALEARLHELHSYQVPEFLVLDIESGSHAYLDWLHAALKSPAVPGSGAQDGPKRSDGTGGQK